MCCVALRCSVLWCAALCGVVVVCGPPHGGACCVGVWPPACWGVLRWGAVCCAVWCCLSLLCPAPLMVWLAALGCGVLRCVALCVALVCSPSCSHGGASHGGVWPPLWWGCVALCFVVSRCVVRCVWCAAPFVVGRAALVCGPLQGGAWCVGVRSVALCGVVLFVMTCPPIWWGALHSCVTPLMVGRSCVVLCCVALGCGVFCCVALCCVLYRCVAHLVVGRAALGCGVLCCVALCAVVVCGPPHGGPCCCRAYPHSWSGCVTLCLSGPGFNTQSA